MRDNWKYSGDDSAAGAIKNNVRYGWVKTKNLARYIGIIAVLLGYYHFFAMAVPVMPIVEQYNAVVISYSGATTAADLIWYHLAVGVVGSIYVWFGP